MILLGADPEFVIKDARGVPQSAHLFFPPKEQPIRCEEGAIHRDGFVVEVNPYAVSCREGVAYLTMQLMKHARKRLPPGWSLDYDAAVRIDPETLRDAPDDVQLFGCEPSWCAYDERGKMPSIDARDHPYRYAGGHLHISGYSWMDGQDQGSLYIRMLDLFVGVPLTFWHAPEDVFLRRRHYGQAGECRFQQYNDGNFGLEYRTPPPYVFSNPAALSYALGTMKLVARHFTTLAAHWNSSMEDVIRHAVNTGEGLEELLPYAGIAGWSDAEHFRALRRNGKMLPDHITSMNYVAGYASASHYVGNTKYGYPSDALVA